MKLQRLYRPEDVTRDAAYKADLNELYASSDIELVDVEWVLRKCMVTAVGATYGEFHSVSLLGITRWLFLG